MVDTKNERSLILLFECRIVDHCGRVNSVHMNASDFEIAAAWALTGFIQFGRIASQDINDNGSHWVTFSDAAWTAAHRVRRERGERMIARRTFQTTDEKRESLDVFLGE